MEKNWAKWRSWRTVSWSMRSKLGVTSLKLFVRLPSGRALLIFKTVIKLLTSLLILWATPGYWNRRTASMLVMIHHHRPHIETFHLKKKKKIARLSSDWIKTAAAFTSCLNVRFSVHSWSTCIFMATSLPSFSLARWTWPIDAAANGRSSNDSSLSLQLGPRSLLNALYK